MDWILSPEVLAVLAGLSVLALGKCITATREHISRSRHPPNRVSALRVWLRVGETWANTFVALLLFVVLFALVMLLVGRVIGPRATVLLIRGALTLTVVTFILSEPLLVMLTRAKRIARNPEEEENYPRVPEALNRLYKRNGWLMLRPRLYVCSLNGMPNAFAFGMGILGQYAVAVTPTLYELLDDDELESVIAHELAHIRHKDVGLLTVVSILTGLCRTFATSLKAVKTPTAIAAGLFLQLLNRLIFPIGVSTIQCEREFSADALGALYKGEPDSAEKALRKLSSKFEGIRSDEQPSPVQEMLKPLTQSHPDMTQRFTALQALKK